jgi:hypothetical protein
VCAPINGFFLVIFNPFALRKAHAEVVLTQRVIVFSGTSIPEIEMNR